MKKQKKSAKEIEKAKQSLQSLEGMRIAEIVKDKDKLAIYLEALGVLVGVVDGGKVKG